MEGVCVRSGKNNDIGEYALFHICVHKNIHKERNYSLVKSVQARLVKDRAVLR